MPTPRPGDATRPQVAFSLSRRRLLCGAAMLGWGGAGSARAEEPRTLKVVVDGIEREALAFPPGRKGEGPLPLVLAIHGHGGGSRQASRSFRIHEVWPEALVVYPQGLPTPGRLTDPEGKRSGWQHAVGDMGDRDLKFIDALLAELKKSYPIDAQRIYAMGHSNGGAFTYTLWAARPEVFAAFAPSAATSRSVLALKPKPAMHVAGENDPLVRFAMQRRAMTRVRDVNGCEATGSEWGKNCTLYPSTRNAPFVEYIHPGTHQFPAEAPALIVKFFQQHRLGEAMGR